jgi:hypothetical protein
MIGLYAYLVAVNRRPVPLSIALEADRRVHGAAAREHRRAAPDRNGNGAVPAAAPKAAGRTSIALPTGAAVEREQESVRASF